MARTLLLLGGINAFLAVALGAFGAHGLRASVSVEMLEVYKTGVHYHLFHALGLLLVGVLAERRQGNTLLYGAGLLLTVGIVLFSGSLYALAISGVRLLGAITPFGGLCFLTGWSVFLAAIARDSRA